MSIIKVFCTDKDIYIEGEILNHKEKVFLDVAIRRSIKLHLVYKNNVYVGSLGGLEFVVNYDEVPVQEQVIVKSRRKKHLSTQ